MRAVSKIQRLAMDQWPEADRQGWTMAQLPEDPFDPSIGYASRWAPSTCKITEQGYGYWLGWLSSTDQLLESEGPVDRPTVERLQAYLAAILSAGLAEYTCAGRVKFVADALRAIAPAGDWAWITRAANRLHASAKPTRDVRSRMRPADEVMQLGLDMMGAAQNDRFRGPIERATLFRDGLMVALMVLRPLRCANFAALELGRHLEKRGETWWIVVSHYEEKTGRSMEFGWPGELAAQLERYLDVYRPALQNCSRTKAGGALNMLWVSQHGTALGQAAIVAQIESRTKQEFGEAINPHTFRSIAATTIATEDPGSAATIAGVLGHSGLRTSEKYYNKARMLDAGTRFAKVISLQRAQVERPQPKPESCQPVLL